MKTLTITMLVAGVTLQSYATPLDLYNDSLYHSGGGVVATPNWNTPGTWLHWNITRTEDNLWHYEYVWKTDGANLSHIIVELSYGAAAQDFSNWAYSYSGVQKGDPEFGYFSPTDPGNCNPGLPGSIYGFKLNPVADTRTFGFSFDTWRSPVWGDFYAKDGKHNKGDSNGEFTYAYNTGFTAVDANDGYHIARPNGQSTPVNDAGLTATLLGLALISIESLRRRIQTRA